MTASESTIEKIYTTAARHFAEYGLEGARMDRIARDAGVNKASIYYNVGNKETLYTFVINQMLEQGFKSFEQVVQSAMTPEQKLAAYVKQIARALENNPHNPKILMREQLSQGRHMSDNFIERIVGVLDGLAAILEQGRREGVFDSVDTVSIHFMILGTLVFHMTSAPIRKRKKSFTEKYQPAPGRLSKGVIEKVTQYILKAVKKEA